MADFKNLALEVGTVTRRDGEDQVQFLPGGDHQVTIISPPVSFHLENPNNAVLG